MRVLQERRRALIVLGIIVVAVVAAGTAGVLRDGNSAEAIREHIEAAHAGFKSGDPDAQTAFAPHRHGLGNPESYASEQLAALAYPASSLSASLLDQESKYYSGTIKSRPKPSRNGWQLAGPSTSTQPAVLNFFDNQASDLGVSGRVTAIAIDSNACDTTSCRVWVAAAGGGIWRTDNALAATPSWSFLSGNFGTNAIGTLTYDAASHTLYAGTGEPNASGDSESGVGIYASSNGGTSWTYLSGSSVMKARSISSIGVDPSHAGTLYVGDTRGVRGVSAVTGGAVSLAPDAAPWGLWKTTDGGQTFSEVWDGHGSLRGVNHVELDSHGTVYAAAFQQGIWRSADGGSTWEQVFATQDPTDNAARTEFALNTTADGHTRIYAGDGGAEIGTDKFGLPTSNTGVYRADAIDTKSSSTLTNGSSNPGFESLTSPDQTNPKWATYDYCEGQCWYDNYVVSPAGHPDTVYVGGSFDYSLFSFADNGKAVLLSTDAGEHWTDQTRDNASPATGIHPDQHALAVDPSNPLLFFEGSDGGVVHSSGRLTDATANCPPASKAGPFATACQNLLKAVPSQISTINSGLSTLQFQGIATHGSTIIGGTQDNGTWLGTAGNASWNQTIYGDGGVAAFDASSPSWSLNEFFGAATDANFDNGDPTKWVIVDGTFASSGEASAFYKPQIGDPLVSGTSFVGLQSVWRTQDFGGDQAYLEAHCPEFTAFSGTAGCGDYAPLGDSSGHGGKNGPSDLTGKHYGNDRAGGYLVALARSTGDTSTLWAATAAGRVLVSSNADLPAGKVGFTRVDNASSPGRFISGIAVDPSNPNHAWVTYTGYNANTPSTPGHVFEVTYDPKQKSATWKDIDNGTGPLGDLPVTSIVRDSSTGTLYVGTDFTVLASSGDGSWAPVANGMPQVEITDLKVDSGTLYAATHGRGLWSLSLR